MRLRVLMLGTAVLALGGCQTLAHRPFAHRPTARRLQSQMVLIDRPLAPGERPWTRVPQGSQIARLYPRRAKAAHLGGRVQLRCRVKPSGRLSRCSVLQESPTGYGFGKATLKYAGLLQLEAGPYGPAVILDVAINWRGDQ